MNGKILDHYREDLKQMIARRFEGENLIRTAMEQLYFYYKTEPSEMLATVYEPSVCIIVQGSKEVTVGHESISYDESDYLLASVHMPAKVRIAEASAASPYMGLTITFTMEQIYDVLKDIDLQEKPVKKSGNGLYFGSMSERLIEPVTRLVRLLDSPEDIPVLSPLIIKEILYVLMRSDGAGLIRQYAQEGTVEQRIVQAITQIKEHFKEPLRIADLARSVDMSESSLYHNFRKITSMSPLQFQKSLRLQEARQILLTREVEAAQVSFDVGYESPSQFNREYARMFGLPPKADARQYAGNRT